MPHAPVSEQQVLGAALLSTEAAEVLLHELRPEDFYDERHVRIAACITTLAEKGDRTDPVSVSLVLEQHGKFQESDRVYLVELQSLCEAPSNARKHATEVLDCAARRGLYTACTAVAEEALNRQVSLADTGARAKQLVGQVSMPVVASAPDPDCYDFVAQGSEPHDWVVPKLLERRDRLVVTADEGYGKSTFLRQMAVRMASGLHPFTEQRINPASALIVDVENGPDQVRRGLRTLMTAASASSCPVERGRLIPLVKPEGLDMLLPSDVRWLYEKVQANRPDVVVIGPIYKLVSGNPNDEEPARTLARVLDTLRARWGCTLLIEAHSPYSEVRPGERTLRPYGASLWSRWPEFGFAIVPDKNEPKTAAWWKKWRGPRDPDRQWPERLERGGSWPWSVSVPRARGAA